MEYSEHGLRIPLDELRRILEYAEDRIKYDGIGRRTEFGQNGEKEYNLCETVIAKYRDGDQWNALGIVIAHDDGLDLFAAIRDAAIEYARTDSGKREIADNNGDFVNFVPEEICVKHGFKLVDTFLTDLIVDHDERLIPET